LVSATKPSHQEANPANALPSRVSGFVQSQESTPPSALPLGRATRRISPEEYGASGGDFRFDVVILQELGRVNVRNFAVPLHAGVLAPYISQYRTEEQKARYLRGGGGMQRDTVLAIVMTEPLQDQTCKG
jgi:hypothetical protein